MNKETYPTESTSGGEKKRLTFNLKLVGLVGLAVAVVAYVFTLDPIAQETDYHHFADQDTWNSIPNFWNVISNVGFLIAGSWGIYKSLTVKPIAYIALVLSFGVALTFIGSSYYHWHPSHQTLVWDRIPMTIIFMSFFGFIISEYISLRYQFLLLFLFLSIGIASVYYWEYTERGGHGDLRAYAIVQFLPMLLIPVIFLLFHQRHLPSKNIIPIFLWYILAKVCEHFDDAIFHYSFISGHSLKHLFAAISTYYMIKWTLKENNTYSLPFAS